MIQDMINNIVIIGGYFIILLVLLGVIWFLLCGIYYLIIRTPKIALLIYKNQLKRSFKNATEASYQRWLKVIEEEYRQSKETQEKEK